MKKAFPNFETDADAEAFVESADLAAYDFSDMKPMRFEMRRGEETVSLRLPEPLLSAVKQQAETSGLPIEGFIRQAIERALRAAKPF